jgi:hypothetical protein
MLGVALALFVQAHYVDAHGATHELSLWRDGARLRRDTDGNLQLFVEHRPDGNDRYHLIDRARARGYAVSRAHLYRIGSFPDWETLSSLAPAPRGRAGRRERTRAGECRWIGDRAREVCWSAALGIALRAREQRDGGWRDVLWVDRLSRTLDRAELAPPSDVPLTDVDRDVAGD